MRKHPSDDMKKIECTCGICGRTFVAAKRSVVEMRKKRLEYLCEGCRPWAAVALKLEHYDRPTAERDIIYAKIRRLRDALEDRTAEPLAGPAMPFWLLTKRWIEVRPQDAPQLRGGKSSCLRHLSLYFEAIPLAEITLEKAQQLRNFFLSETNSRGSSFSQYTVNGLVITLRRMLTYAARQGWIASNPLVALLGLTPPGSALTPRRVPPKGDRLVLLEEEQKLLSACVGEFADLREPIIYLADTGAYESTRKGLTWPDVDFESRRVRAGGKGYIVWVDMSERLFDAMRSLWERRGRPLEGRVWPLPAKNDFDRLCSAARVARLQLGAFRRTTAFRMAQAAKSMAEIGDILGLRDLNRVRMMLDKFGTSSNSNGQKNGVPKKRGPKKGQYAFITWDNMRNAFERLDSIPTKAEAARVLGVTESGIDKWLQSEKVSWRQVQRQFINT